MFLKLSNLNRFRKMLFLYDIFGKDVVKTEKGALFWVTHTNWRYYECIIPLFQNGILDK